MTAALTVHGRHVVGEIAIEIGPATLAAERDRALDAALATPLSDIALEHDSVLAAAPNKYARAVPGKDANGLTRFKVRARLEGGRLVPELKGHG